MRASGLVTVAALAGCLVPSAALACGGLFCNSGLTQPVDQSAEQIIFAREGDHSVAHIQISYTGSLPDFGWIVPLKTAPTKYELGSMTPFTELQQATAPQFLRPPSPNSGFSGCVPSCASSVSFSRKSSPGEDSAGNVTVIDKGSFGEFNYVLLESTDAQDLYDWLADHNYNTPDGAKPIVQKYLDEQSKFLALKLQPEATVQDILPIKLTFPNWDPCIPIRLTAIAAKPDMGVLVYIVGETRAEPVGYGSVQVDTNLIKLRTDGGAPTNYRTVLTTAIKNAGRHAFTTEFANTTASVMNTAPVTFSQETLDVLQSSPYITRLYTVLSPDDMTIDPTFSLSDPGKLGNVSNVHQLPSSSLSGSMAPVETIFLATLAGSFLRRRKSHPKL